MGQKYDDFWSGNSAYKQGIGQNVAPDMASMFNSAQNADYSGFNKFLKTIFTPSGGLEFIGDKLGFNSSKDVGEVAYTKNGVAYDPNNLDSQINAQNTDLAYQRDDNSIARWKQQMLDAGINPVLALGNSSGIWQSEIADRSNYNVSAKDQLNSALKIGTIMAIIFKALAA